MSIKHEVDAACDEFQRTHKHELITSIELGPADYMKLAGDPAARPLLTPIVDGYSYCNVPVHRVAGLSSIKIVGER